MNIYRWCPSDERWEQVACTVTSEWARIVLKGLQIQRPTDHFFIDTRPPLFNPTPSKVS